MSYYFQIGATTSYFAPVKELFMRCMDFDKTAFSTYLDICCQYTSLDYPQNVLVWQQGKLVGYLEVFFLKLDCPEVILLVDPQYRHQGVAKQLLEKLNAILAQLEVNQFLLINTLPNLDTVLHGYGARQAKMKLVLQLSKWRMTEKQHTLKMRLAKLEDLELLVSLHQQCFKTTIESSRKRFVNYFNESQPNSVVYVFYHKEVLIGKLQMYTSDTEIKLYDICISPNYQRQQFGFAMMQDWYDAIGKCINKSLVLEVLSDNTPALKLYQKCGFQIIAQLTYWLFHI